MFNSFPIKENTFLYLASSSIFPAFALSLLHILWLTVNLRPLAASPSPLPRNSLHKSLGLLNKKILKTKQKINMCRFIAAFVFSMHRQINIMEIRSLCSALLSTVQYDKKIPVLCREKNWLDKLCYCTITRSWRKRIIKVEHNVKCNQYKYRLRWHWIAEGQNLFCIWCVAGKALKDCCKPQEFRKITCFPGLWAIHNVHFTRRERGSWISL